ncbi:MAG: hypothetical protein LW832_02730, partial [Parachlamydia sp.]|nr:hypothetical protein [Parachlamydia sp.]
MAHLACLEREDNRALFPDIRKFEGADDRETELSFSPLDPFVFQRFFNGERRSDPSLFFVGGSFH